MKKTTIADPGKTAPANQLCNNQRSKGLFSDPLSCFGRGNERSLVLALSTPASCPVDPWLDMSLQEFSERLLAHLQLSTIFRFRRQVLK